ncbi:MAG: glycosyltransferase family 1 protein [Patescibacteria group bacterium]
MTIGIDLRVLARNARTGVEEYTINLLSRMIPLKPEIKYRFFYNAFSKTPLDFKWAELPNAEIRDFKIPNRFVFDPLARFFNLPKVDRLLGGTDVFFSPHFLLTPLSKNCRRVLTIHDLSFSHYPEFFSFSKRLWHKSLNIEKQAASAGRLIVPSRSTKADLVNFYGVSEEKIKVIHHGVSPEFSVISENDGRLAGIKAKYRLPDKFILHLGTVEPRKNVLGLIRAFEVLKSDKNYGDLNLVIAGGLGWLYKEVLAAAKKSRFSGNIKFVPPNLPEERPYFYNLAELFVFPSFFEGFGLPILEALACGTPVVSSNNSSLPEVLGNAGLLIDPYDVEQICSAMKEILGSGELREILIKRGLERAKNFTWEKCAEETLEEIMSGK